MDSKLSSTIPTCLLLIFFFSPSLAIIDTPQLVCNLTPFPLMCTSILSQAKPGTLHDYGRFCMHQSLLDAIQSLSLIEHYLQLPSTSYLTTIRALEDCRSLASLNIDFLTQTFSAVNSSTDTSSTSTLDSYQADDLETLLSAIITNQVTCLDGLQALESSASSMLSDLLVFLFDVSKKHSVTLALFKHGNWGGGDGSPNENRKVYKSVLNGRKLLGINTTTDDQNKYYSTKVNVSTVVVVRPDGSGDFATINDAVAAAPNNTDKSYGYFMIYVAAGVYEEYVSIPKYKKYLMMVGDGINQTVITGNRNVVDGWTTFNSATFGLNQLLIFPYQFSSSSSSSLPPPPHHHQSMPHHNPSAISHNTQITANPFYMAKMAQYMTMVAFACTIPYHKLKKFYSLIQHHLINLPPSSKNSTTTIRTALEDCSFLASLNIDFLSQTLKAINSSTDSTTLESSIADDSETFLSATLTNQETCFDGLPQALESSSSSSTNNSDLLVPLVNGTKSFSVSLAIFKHGWLRNTKRSNRKVYETVNGRLLLQQVINISSGQVVNVSAMVVVKPDGSGNFTTINEAVAAAPNNTDISKSNGYFMIYVVAGVYEEYVSIPSNKKYLMMVGDGINQTVITGNRSVVDGSTTFNSATFAVVGQGFVGVNMTIRNTAGAIKHQAVAVRNGADMSTFYNCSFEGYQDTLYPHSLRQFYRDCDVYGTVDFIFGNAAVVLQNCNIYPRLPMQNQFNAVTAQGRTDPNQNTGISIHNCTIKAADDLASNSSSDISSTKTYLGRPWKEYSRTVYMETFMDSLIDPSGWKAWSGDFALSTLYYAEYNNTGPGSNTTNRVTWPGYHVINETNDAVNFTVSNFIQGNFWLPATGVPFIEGLLP
ncbi:hypothetical protein Q3G72_023604 [Acer saccharum]|nr:hypothetical protein Q3G72_023604 [Acer saccharum]